jgi:hypothetical protein
VVSKPVVVRERRGVVTRGSSSGMIRVSVGLVRRAEFRDWWGAFKFSFRGVRVLMEEGGLQTRCW